MSGPKAVRRSPELLPPELRRALRVLSRRLKVFRLARGIAAVVLIYLATAGIVMLLDRYLILSDASRALLLVGSLGLTAAVAVFRLILPLLRRYDHEAIALGAEVHFTADPSVRMRQIRPSELISHNTPSRTVLPTKAVIPPF